LQDEPPGGDREALVLAQETIGRQAEEIESLRRRLAEERLAEDLREALTQAAAAAVIASPVSHSRLLEMIVETAASVIFARSAALFLIDEDAQDLTFEVALGSKAEEVKKLRVPLGHGVAGLVAVSGQPMAVSDAGSDPRQATDIAARVDYKPQSILCVPLFYGDRIIGVLELLDKEGATSFSADDMQDLGFFANQAAVAIEQSRASRSMAALLVEVLQGIGEKDGVRERARSFAERLEEDASFGRALDLARLVQEISSQGEDELAACRKILRGFAEYLRSRPGSELGDVL
jgi:GAF domain-containing protein